MKRTANWAGEGFRKEKTDPSDSEAPAGAFGLETQEFQMVVRG